jgi:hypothetical protein
MDELERLRQTLSGDPKKYVRVLRDAGERTLKS